MKSFCVIKIAIGIRMFPKLNGKDLAKQINMPVKAIYTYYGQAAMYARSWIPNLVTAEQLAELSGRELTVLHYLYTAEPDLKIAVHTHNLGMTDKTFYKALRKLRQMDLIPQGVTGKVNTYTIQKLDTALPLFLN